MNIPKIKVQFEYNNNIGIIEIESYKSVSILYDKAESLFHPLNFSLNNKILTFNNKDIADKGIIPIGELFRNKTRVTLKITDLPIKINKENKSPSKKINNEYYNPEEDFLVSRKVNVESKSGNNQLDSTKHNSSLNSLYCSCKAKEQINFYCRKCKEFICKNCRFNPEHLNHKTIVMDINKPNYLENSVSLYCMNVQADISLCSKAVEGYSNLFKSIDLFNFKESKEKLMKKIDYFESKIQNLTTALPKVESGDKVTIELEKANKKVNEEVAKILNDIEKIKISKLNNSLSGTNTMNRSSLNNSINKEKEKTDKENLNKAEKDIFDLLDQVSNLELDVENLSQRSLALKLNYDVHRRIEEIYKNMILSFDSNVFTEDYKFNLEFDARESKFIPNEITTILRQTANSKGNSASASIQNLINLGKTLKKEMDEERTKNSIDKNKEKEKEKEKEKNDKENKDKNALKKEVDIKKESDNKKDADSKIADSRKSNKDTVKNLDKMDKDLKNK